MSPVQAPAEIQEVLDSMSAVKGPMYMQLVMHSVNLTVVMNAIEDLSLRLAVALASAPMMSDIATLANIDVNSPTARKEYEADVRNMLAIMKKKQ